MVEKCAEVSYDAVEGTLSLAPVVNEVFRLQASLRIVNHRSTG